jgi:chemotaxis protein MotB
MAVLGLGVLASMGSGCVSKQEFDNLHAAWQRADEARAKAESALEKLRAENALLLSQMEEMRGLMAKKDATIASLEDELRKANERYATLKALYEKELGKPVKDVVFVSGPALPAGLDALLRKLAADHSDILEYDAEHGMVKLKADLTFEPGKVDIKPAALAALKALADILNSADAAPFNAYIAGHTDDMPLENPATIAAHGSNWGLSAHRALAVVKALFEAKVDQPRLGALAFSWYHPVAANAPGHKGNAANRRVEIWIVPPDKFLTVKTNVPVESDKPIAPKG